MLLRCDSGWFVAGFFLSSLYYILLLTLLEYKKLSTSQPLWIYDNSRLEEAFRSFKDGDAMGRSVGAFHKDDVVAVHPTTVKSRSEGKVFLQCFLSQT